ncbi:glycosyltransferase [Roseivivax sp. GX 12232]|uniref:glycosyltransferase family 2 protein n=1 Tax=Roseivivax sp. GX 12232 TaxID=2900547 RepID=UPI001E5991B8|nr:glycosyltransferase [Roseivivax sp. GX 12232]
MQVQRQTEFRQDHDRAVGATAPGLLLARGRISARDLVSALQEAARTEVALSQVLLARGLASAAELAQSRGAAAGAPYLDPLRDPPDPELAGLLPVDIALSASALPWRLRGKTLLIAAASEEGFAEAARALEPLGFAMRMGMAAEADILAEIGARHGAKLVDRAETALPEPLSCREFGATGPGRRALALGIAALAVGLLWVAPLALFASLLALATLSLLASQALRVAALIASRRPDPPDPPAEPPLPRVALLVPLFHESDIAPALAQRIGRLTYPRSALEVLLVLEDSDRMTAEALARADLPGWCRIVTVPEGRLRTKPRALNYALNFTRAEIIGVLDAEDAPAPDQVERIVARFRARGPEVACLQGVLDFYNPKANWLSRCFAIEYASWFRMQLPGLARLGVPVPLGGTTVYFRRAALEAVGGWDAFNVTEDADLGIRLARQGFRTEIVPTVTREEANNRPLPWVKQRSRWLKGYAMTWAAHSRAPGRLVRDLGPWRAGGVQILFLGALLQFLLAPALWSFWLILAGLPHPAQAVLAPEALGALFALFITAEGVSVLASLIAVSRTPHTGLMPWVPSLILYYPLGTAAAWKAIWEVIWRPFYWDKTQHGASAPDAPGADVPKG